MSYYVVHLGLTAWRRKSALLLAGGLLSLIIFGLQYSRIEEEKAAFKDGVVAAALEQNVKFVVAAQNSPRPSGAARPITEVDAAVLAKLEAPSRDDIARRAEEALINEQQLGVPYVNLDPKKPPVPTQRIVHFDLKGAPPVVGFYKKFFPMIKNLGATGILFEYEDMFPFEGPLKEIAAKNAYSRAQISEILQLAENSHLDVIPLVQTFGHVEFALKHEKFSTLREVEGSPQALCPSRNASLDFIKEMVSQVIALHPKIKYLHIGCDEVFQIGECEVCRLELHETLFLKHVKNVATHIHEKHPKLQLIIWDDMLRHVSQMTMNEMNLGEMVEPMVWVYAEDIYRFVQPPIWDKYAAVFRSAWAASAFKGAFGETLYVPDARRHLENNLRWLDVMAQQGRAFRGGFTGLALTGWQRYDHFAVLCELLPAAIPSLALNLIAVTHGYFNSSLKQKFLGGLSCPHQHSSSSGGGRAPPFISLETDPYMWDKMGRCMFPGSPFFRITYRLHTMESEVNEYLDTTKRHKGWMTDYNVRHNYSLPLRVDELTSDLARVHHGATSLVRSTVDAMIDVFDNYTISEWIEQRLYPFIIELEKIQNQSIALKSVNHWQARPLPPLRDLQRLGVPIPN